jgi:hypothetical protein
MVKVEEQALVEELVAHAAVELSQKSLCIGFPGAFSGLTESRGIPFGLRS